MKSLESLSLRRTPISDLTPLAKLTSLESLSLSSMQVSDLTPLANLTSLQELSLAVAPASDLTPLAELKNLRYLFLYKLSVSKEQVEELEQALPNCRFGYHPRARIEGWPPSSDPSP